jgi:rhamnosyltransferase
MFNEVLILIVTFNGADTIGQTLDSFICHRGESVLVIDNASSDNSIDVIQSLSLPNIEIIRMSSNRGVAAAFNLGLDKAIKKGKKWLWILDQDTVCGQGCLDQLILSARELIHKGERLGAIGPTVRSYYFPEEVQYPYRWNGYKLTLFKDETPGAVSVDSTLSSGTLYNIAALQSVNGFRETYFIDFVDHECHLRQRKAGWSIWWEKDAEIYHRLGKLQRKTGSGLWVEHSSFRYYYMARNMAEGHMRLGGIKALLYFLIDVFRHIRRLRSYGSEPGRSILYILKGIKDALLGKSGQLDSKT